MPNPREVVADFLILARKRRGLTQSELARDLGISERALRAWERAESLPDAHRVDLIEEVLALEHGGLLDLVLEAKAKIDEDRRERALRLRREAAEHPAELPKDRARRELERVAKGEGASSPKVRQPKGGALGPIGRSESRVGPEQREAPRGMG